MLQFTESQSRIWLSNCTTTATGNTKRQNVSTQAPLGRVTPWTAARQPASSLLIYSLTQKNSFGCMRHLRDIKPNKT